MNTNKRLWGALAAFLTMGVLATGAGAANPAQVNISVTITAAMSVSVDGVATSTRPHTWSGAPNDKFVNTASSITVLNDSLILTEKWALSSNATSIPASGTGWTLGASSSAVGADTFALQAVFGSSNTADTGCLGAAAATWDDSAVAPLLTTTAETYTSTKFGSAELTAGGGSKDPDEASGDMYAGDKRVLCYRTIMPASTSKTAVQNVQVVVTAQ